jgi:hypothetical protein
MLHQGIQLMIKVQMPGTTGPPHLNQGEGRNRAVHRFRPCFFGSFLQEQKRTEKKYNEMEICSDR